MEILRSERRAVLLGDPGGGKSTLLAAHVIEEIRSRTNRLAVKCRLSDLALMIEERRKKRKSSQLELAACLMLILRCAESEYDLSLGSERAEFAHLLSTSSEAVIALDGLDEVPHHLLEILMKVLTTLDALPGCIVLTSRRTGYQGSPWKESKELSVDHLTTDQSGSFLESWFRGTQLDGAHQRAVDAIGGNHAALGRIPVLLGIIALVAESGESLPPTTSGLYDKYLDLFLQERWRYPVTRMTAVEVSLRMRVARTIAWSMALGGSPGVTGSQWADVSTVARLYQAVNPEFESVVTTLYKSTGLLIAHGSGQYVGAQEVRWLHRTVHEYLVGAYLAELHSLDLAQWEEIFSLILQTLSIWDQPVRFMMDIIPEKQHPSIFRFAESLKKQGDPGGIMLAMMQTIAESMDRNSFFRQATARMCAEAKLWQDACKLNTEATRDLFLESLRNPETRHSSLYAIPFYLRGRDTEIRDELNLALKEPLSDYLVWTLISAIRGSDPEEGFRATIEAIERGYRWQDYRYFGSSLPWKSEIRRALTNARGARSETLSFLIYLGVDLSPFEQEFPWILEEEPLRDLRSIGMHRLDPQELKFFLGARGVFGPVHALECGRGYTGKTPDCSLGLSPWASLGSQLALLESHVWGGDSHGHNNVRGDNESTTAGGSLTEPEELSSILNRVVAWNRNPTNSPIHEILDLGSRLLKFLDGASSASKEFAARLIALISKISAQRPRELIRAILLTDSGQWAPIASSGRKWFLNQPELFNEIDVNVFIELLAWAVKGDIEILSDIGMLDRPPEWIRIAEIRGIPYESLPAKSQRLLTYSFASEGVLPDWRDRILRVLDK